MIKKDLWSRVFTPMEFIIYYRNVWLRNYIAAVIDIKNDQARVNKNPNEQVLKDDKSGYEPVLHRLENRKVNASITYSIYAVANELMSASDEDILAFLDEKFLDVSPEFIKAQEEQNQPVPVKVEDVKPEEAPKVEETPKTETPAPEAK